MKCYYDLHIHTALSPCGDRDMTPNNIVNMAVLNELNVIAITDHNACQNIEPIMKIAKTKDLLVIPGMEIETREEVHVVTLFSSVNDVYNMHNIVSKHLPSIRNKEKIFGEQLIFNEFDDVIGVNNQLLSTATDLTIDQVFEYTRSFNGIAIPAHIDRPSYSILSNLGWIPDNLNITTLEISRYAEVTEYKDKYSDYNVIQSSDAHELGNIFSASNFIETQKLTIDNILKLL